MRRQRGKLMDIKHIRLSNMMWLIQSECDNDQTTFGERVDISAPQISHIKNVNSDRNIGSKLARKIEKAFNKPEFWLDKESSITEKQAVSDGESVHGLLGSVTTWDRFTPLNDNEVEVPYYMDIELAAGCGMEYSHEIKGPTLRFNKGFLRRKGVSQENAVCVRVAGDSMEPKLSNGDVVAVDRGRNSINDGDTYAIDHDGLLRIKRLYLMPGGGVRISSFNLIDYSDEVLSAKERKLVKIIGRIFHSISDW
jgi:phage repressor protein C with HTH and peptisase S24 domain